MSDYILYGSQASLFTGKVRAYMNWKGVDFEERAVNETIMKTVILPHVGWAVVPVIQTKDGRIIQDSWDIMTEIEAASPVPPLMPDGPVQRFASLLIQLYGDQWLTLPAMHYRWNYNEEWVLTQFGQSAAPDAPAEQHYSIGKKIGERFRAMVPMLGVTESTIAGIESSYEAFLSEFSAHLEHYDFVFGARPSLADFALCGPLYAHLYRDPASREIMERVAPRVAQWVRRIISAQSNGGDTAGLVAGDVIPDSLFALLRRHSAEHLPVLEATNDLFTAWCETAASGDAVPRMLGTVPFHVDGCDGQTIARSFSLFRLQAALDSLATMSASERAQAEAFLKDINAQSLMSFKLPRRLERKNCKLCLA